MTSFFFPFIGIRCCADRFYRSISTRNLFRFNRKNFALYFDKRRKYFLTMATSQPSGTSSQTCTVQQQELTLKPTKQIVEIFRKDYKPPIFLIDEVFLDFELVPEKTRVVSELTIRRRAGTPPGDLKLNGEDLKLVNVLIDGNKVPEARGHSNESISASYSLDIEGNLVISASLLPADSDKAFVVKTEVLINPFENLQLMGLYMSSGMFCTQCEAEGFRRITYFIDRPDVMSLYKVRLSSCKSKFPVLLSNGNKVDEGDLDGGKHFAVYEDPHKKPCYLFALVAGNLNFIQRYFQTMSGRRVSIEIYSIPEDSSRLEWALQSVEWSMKWDEEKFGREYDLNEFRVVCVRDFNMGAMENKGLNIFNCALLVADPKITTDIEYQHIMNVVGHEYFHNWTGNRVTCRDWFQLTLKEGLTVFRDQQFTADMCSVASKRIEELISLTSAQFAEDAGAMSHPIRPESYIAMDNFYTATVYSKGAEVIRMYHTLLGADGFRKGMDLYFERHDGCAVTCDDFRSAMADANGKDLTQFELWYSQAGTPELEVCKYEYDQSNKKFILCVRQVTKPTAGQKEKHPLHIPIKVGLIGRESKKDVLQPSTRVLELTESEQTFELDRVEEPVVVSFLRNFSAPVKVKPFLSSEDLSFLMSYDSDPVNKWCCAERLARAEILRRVDNINKGLPVGDPPCIYLQAFKSLLCDRTTDLSIKALTLRLPEPEAVEQEMSVLDPVALHKAMRSIRLDIFRALKEEILELYKELTIPEDQPETMMKEDVARRRLRNVLLHFAACERDDQAAQIAYTHFTAALKKENMTDLYQGLLALTHIHSHSLKDLAVTQFHEYANGNDQVLDKWFRAQAMTDHPSLLEKITELSQHPDFKLKNPNRMRSLYFPFMRCSNQFHREDGEGYKMMADVILEVDSFNPQLASRTAGPFLMWCRYTDKLKTLMKEQLQRMNKAPGKSPDLSEIIAKALACSS